MIHKFNVYYRCRACGEKDAGCELIEGYYGFTGAVDAAPARGYHHCSGLTHLERGITEPYRVEKLEFGK